MMTMTMTNAAAARTGSSAGRPRPTLSSIRSWAPVWVRPVVAAPAPGSPSTAGVRPSATGSPARLDEATRRLLRVPSLVAETAARWNAGSDQDVDAPVRPVRRRARRSHARRPPSGLIRVAPVLGGVAGCDTTPGHAVAPVYRMSRLARLSLTLTVAAALVVLAAHALTPAGTTATTSVTVGVGDTLWSIAERTAPDAEVWSTIDEISALNGLTGSDIRAGQVLVVPAG